MQTFVLLSSLLLFAAIVENSEAEIDDASNKGKLSIYLLAERMRKQPIAEETYEKQSDSTTKKFDATDASTMHDYLDVLSRKRNIVESWLDLAMKNKFQDPSSPLPALPPSPKKKKNPSTYSWGNRKRQRAYEENSNVHRPMRIPFYSWGGKRGKQDSEYFESAVGSVSHTKNQIKRNKVAVYDRDTFGSGNSAKNKPGNPENTNFIIPFHSWAGKRDDKMFADRDALLNEHGYFKGRNEDNYQETIAAMAPIYEWKDGIRNTFLYTIPLQIHNQTSDNDYKANNIDDWSYSIPGKRIKPREKYKNVFDPWGGKRSLNAMVPISARDLANLPFNP